MKTILVAIDSEKGGELVAQKAIEVASAFEATIHLFHVSFIDKDIVVAEPGIEYLSPVNVTEYEREMQSLNYFKSKFTEAGIRCEVHLAQGFADKQILKFAQKIHAELIIMGLIHHGFLYKTFVGSVSEQIIKETKIPLLLVPSESL